MARGMFQQPVLYHGVFMQNFKAFHFHKQINNTLQKLGYVNPTSIQAEAIPHIIKGVDLLGLAQTGTGKTAAFTLPILDKLGKNNRENSRKHLIKALVIAPTRELAEQTQEYLQKFTHPLKLKSGVAYGGVSRQVQAKKLREGVDILVACPGRLLDLVNTRDVSLHQVETLVLDEADLMFDKGFLPDIRRIIGKLPENRQNLVFSATMPKEVRILLKELLVEPVVVEIGHQKAVKSITHTFFQVEQNHKTALLKYLLQEKNLDSAIIFTRTRMKAKRLADQLEKSGFTATSIQGNLSQQKRQKALDSFKKGVFRFLVATDVASRGIDIAALPLVINFDMPENTEVYTHRTGRTGRAGAKGAAYSFTTSKDIRLLRMLQKQLGEVEYQKTNPEVFATKTKPNSDKRDIVKEQYKKDSNKKEIRTRKEGMDRRNDKPFFSKTKKNVSIGLKQRGKRSSKKNQQEKIIIGSSSNSLVKNPLYPM